MRQYQLQSVVPRRRRTTGWVLAVLSPVLLAGALLPARSDLALSSVLLLFLLAVLLPASVGGVGPALSSSLIGFFIVNWFFTPPYHTWEVEHLDNVLALFVFLLVGGVVSFYGAIAGRRAAEAALAEAGTELRNALLAAVSHDFRTPLASIKASATSLLADDLQWSTDDVRQFGMAIDEETDRLGALVANLLDMTRLTTGPLPVRQLDVGLDELVLAAVTSLGERAGATQLEIDVDEALPAVRTDPHLVERALANVVDNALAWAPEGTTVRIEACIEGEQAQVRVIDQGPGIPPSEREDVFRPFQRLGDRSNGPGVGLGLAVARGMLQAVGGTLRVEETSGGGTTMVMGLPLTPGPDR